MTVMLLIIFTANCERDDICAETTPTTPNLNASFFDIALQDAPKAVNGLNVRAEDQTEFISVSAPFNSLSLPLFFNEENISTVTRYEITKDAALDDDDNNSTNSNTDVIELRYEPQFVYVSRACGYKSIFNNLTITIIPDDNNWLLSAEVINPIVQNENEVHINLFH